jgi:hypothetical protein
VISSLIKDDTAKRLALGPSAEGEFRSLPEW